MIGRASTPGEELLVSTSALAAHLDDPHWLVCDVRHSLAAPEAGMAAYQAGHVPGSVFLHLDRDLSGGMTGRNGRHPLPSVQDLAALFSSLGIRSHTQVVVLDDAGGMIAGRLWWLLRWLGHDKVALLDGGWLQWVAEGRPVSQEVPDRLPAGFTHQVRSHELVTVSQLEGLLATGQALVLDARSPDRFRGENETLDPVGGRIPGSRNRFLKDNLGADGRMKSPEILREEFCKILGDVPPERVVHSCGSGVSACLNQLAMERAGLNGSRLYAGSWSEWCSDPQRPIAKGAL